MQPVGSRRWVIAEGYIPEQSMVNAGHAFVSHETACVLNAGDADVELAITLFFADREPVGPYAKIVGARRTLHLRFNDLEDPEPVPRGTDYSCVIECSAPVVVQHTRLDSRAAEVSLMTTMAYPAG